MRTSFSKLNSLIVIILAKFDLGQTIGFDLHHGTLISFMNQAEIYPKTEADVREVVRLVADSLSVEQDLTLVPQYRHPLEDSFYHIVNFALLNLPDINDTNVKQRAPYHEGSKMEVIGCRPAVNANGVFMAVGEVATIDLDVFYGDEGLAKVTITGVDAEDESVEIKFGDGDLDEVSFNALHKPLTNNNNVWIAVGRLATVDVDPDEDSENMVTVEITGIDETTRMVDITFENEVCEGEKELDTVPFDDLYEVQQ